MNQTPAERRISTPIAILAVVLLVLVPVLSYLLPAEFLRWQAAAAVEQFDAGERATAIDKLKKISNQLPHDNTLKLRLIRTLLEDDRADEAVKICEQLLERQPDSADAYSVLWQCLMEAGHYDRALELCKSVAGQKRFRGQELITYKNNLSYVRALAGAELERAYTDMNQLLDAFEGFSHWQNGIMAEPETKMVVYCSLALHELGRTDESLSLLKSELDAVNERLADEQQRIKQHITEELTSSEEFSMGKAFRARRMAHQRLTDSQAVLYAVLSRICEDINEEQEACDCQFQALLRGRELDEVVDQLPSRDEFVTDLQYLSHYFDTRGLVLFKLGKIRSALVDMDLAILAAELFYKLQPYTYAANSEQTVNAAYRQRLLDYYPRKAWASMLYHRMHLLESQRIDELARQDRAMIEKLGFDPSENLN